MTLAPSPKYSRPQLEVIIPTRDKTPSFHTSVTRVPHPTLCFPLITHTLPYTKSNAVTSTICLAPHRCHRGCCSPAMPSNTRGWHYPIE